MALFQLGEHGLHLLESQELVGVLPQHIGQVQDQVFSSIPHPETSLGGHILVLFGDPGDHRTIDGMDGLGAGDVEQLKLLQRFAHQDVALHHLALSHRHLVNVDHVGLGLHVHGLASYLNAGEVYPQFIIEAVSQQGDELIYEPASILGIVHEGDDGAAHLQGYGAGHNKGQDITMLADRLPDRLLFGGLHDLLDHLLFGLYEKGGYAPHDYSQYDERYLGKSRNYSQNPQKHRGDDQRLGIGRDLGHDIAPQIGALALRGYPGHHDTCGHGYDQGRDLLNQAVAYGQKRIGPNRLAEAQIPNGHSDDQPPNDVDQGDDHPGDGIALDELHGPVHGAVELAFPMQGHPALEGLLHVDDPGAQIRVDGHLFAGHGIQGETGRHLRDPLRTLGDDDEVDQGHDDEQDSSHHIVALDHEGAEGPNHLTGVGAGQNQSGGGYIERQAIEGGDQQYGGEG